ncbi:hypothetical protein CRUP_019907 [Coryphaenoides rupestris]|nr:hypothetical protein CRUP_019907 [Coryphaenoides rupestris]
MNTITNSSPRRATKASSENTRIRVGVQPRAPVAQSRLAAKKQGAAASNLAKPKLKNYLGAKGYTGHGHLDSEVTKLGLLDFLESVGEFGKMERFSQVIQVAHWDLEAEQHWDVLRDRLDHLDRLEKVNREVKLAYIARLHEKDLDLGDFEEQDFSDVLDEMGNIDMSWKLYKGRGGTLGDSQEFSDAGVDLTAPSDCDEPLASDSLTPSPVSPPPRPPKPPARHASVNSDLHTYINISRETTSIAVSTCPTPTFSTFSPNSSPTFSTFRCEKALPPSPPSIPPLPASQPIPYLTLYTAPLPPPLHTPTPPIPPPRKRHLARKEAQRLAALQAQQEKTPLSLPPPTTRPPPLPPPPTISVASSSPPEIPQPPPLPPPPSFHALDVEIRKLLMLAGLTQAELLKLSPELSVCVGGLEDEGGHSATSPKSEVAQEIIRPIIAEGEAVAVARSNKGELDTGKRMDVVDGKKQGERTTSFTEMARRRKRNSGLMSEVYYSTETFHRHSSPLSDSPPPPPPRPLPPIPPSLPPPRVCTLSDNSARPERFDWLIAFTPDTEALLLQPPPPPPALETTTSAEVVDTPKKLTSSSSGSSTGSGPKVTTFKELRFRNRNTSPPMKVITDPEPDPSIVTPDPDILYNLKWRREKKAGDGEGGEHQWEYTSQAQAFFMQPPPALTSMDALKEMLQRADEEGRRAELCAAQKLGCSAARDGNLWTSGEERGKKPREEEAEAAVVRAKEKRVEQPGAQVEVRGRADGGRTLESRTIAVRRVSFAGSVQSDRTSWMAEDVKLPVRRFGLTPICLQEKKALVSMVSVAVEAILAQFSSSRTVVQKALSGDSSVNPTLGRLVLQCLCPALHGLLSDGLKPHQCDVIAGRRPNSAWGLVQASTKPGPLTQTVYNLQVRVGQLPQLRQSKHRFNAFLFGLLNTKLLDFWLSHLQSCSDVLETFYQPSSFMRVSPAVGLYEELLLLLQPLSLLTFNLDLLFQHHHLSPANHGPPAQEAGFRLNNTRGPLSEGGRVSGSSSNGRLESLSKLDAGVPASSDGQGSGASPCIDAAAPSQPPVAVKRTSPQLLWVQEKEIRDLPPPALDEGGFSQQAGQVLQEGWEAVLRLGGRLSRNLSELSLPAGEGQGRDDDTELYSPAGSDFPRVDSTHNVPWGFGRLFGVSKGAAGNISGHTPQTRRPSQWLGPGVTALTRMVSSSSLPTLKRAPEPQRESQSEAPAQEVEIQSMGEKPRQLRSVRTLCDHAAGTGSELSFQKGEELVVLEGVDHDWIRCRQGEREGLVPIGYTSLIM